MNSHKTASLFCRRIAVKVILFLQLFCFSGGLSLVEAACTNETNCNSSIGVELRLLPTSLVVTPHQTTAVEGSGSIR
jgi:hypothetical protein